MNYMFARLNVYDLLRRIFIEEPSVPLLQYLKTIDMDYLVPHEELNVSSGIEYLANSLNYLKGITISTTSQAYQELHWDYTQLFIGPHELPASPWESSYKHDRLLFTQTTMDVAKFYSENGFYLPESEHEAADHIGFELDFMYHLARNVDFDTSLLSFKNIHNVKNQVNFLENHLLSFLDELMGKIQNSAQTDFYINISRFTKEFINYDYQEIKTILLSTDNK